MYHRISIADVSRLQTMSTQTETLSASVIEDETHGLDVEAEKSSLACSFQSYSPPLLNTSLGTAATYPWTRWVESLRLRRRDYRPAPFVNGWHDGPSVGNEDVLSSPWDNRPWDQVSGRSSSILGTVKTTSMSIPPSSAPRSRANTVASSSIVPSRQSIESTHSTIYDAMTHASRLMAIKCRHVLREIYSSEENYVNGLQTILQVSGF
jgi:hypothetical protein